MQDKKWFSQVSNKVYILPTFQGLCLGVGCLVLFVSSILQGYTLSYVLTVTLITLILTAGVLANSNLQDLSLESLDVRPVAVEQDCQNTVKIQNTGNEPRLALEVRLYQGKHEMGIGYLPEVVGNESRLVTIWFQAKQRGIYEMSRVKLSSKYPLGLFTTWSWRDVSEDYFVYPKPLFERDRDRKIRGNGGKKRAGFFPTHGADFSEHRPYRFGDSLRRIDWKIFARTEQYMVKEFQDGSGGKRVVRWEDATRVGVEDKLAQLTAWLLYCAQQGDLFALYLPRHKTTFGSHEEHLMTCLRLIAGYQHE